METVLTLTKGLKKYPCPPVFSESWVLSTTYNVLVSSILGVDSSPRLQLQLLFAHWSISITEEQHLRLNYTFISTALLSYPCKWRPNHHGYQGAMLQRCFLEEKKILVSTSLSVFCLSLLYVHYNVLVKCVLVFSAGMTHFRLSTRLPNHHITVGL